MKAVFLVLFLSVMALPSLAQDSFVGAGIQINRSSNYDPTPATSKDGGSTFTSVYVEAGLKLPANFQARLLAEYSQTPQLQSIFATDEGSRKATGEFRIRPELRHYFNPESNIRPFIAGGVDIYHQRFSDQPTEEEPIYEHYPSISEEYEYGHTSSILPRTGVNPFISFGVGIGNSHEASFSRLFTDPTNLNPSKLSGYRVNYSFTRPIRNRLAVTFGIEADWLRFRETNGAGYIDNYYEKDTVIKARIGIQFQ